MKKTFSILLVLSTLILVFGISYRVTAMMPASSDAAAAAELLDTGITYQGYLEDSGGPITENCDFQFSVYGSLSGTDQIGSTQSHLNEWVENGNFTVQHLDFGTGVFQGDERYMEIAVSCPTGLASYTTLTPRQPVSPSPYALALPGLWTQNKSPSPNLIGGYSGNQVGSNVWGATIGGGGSDDLGPNTITDHYSTIAGGVMNLAGNDTGAIYTTDMATVGGGGYNTAHGWASTISGGYTNTITNTANAATIAGGQNNTITGEWTNTIGGGDSNTASGYWNATVAGGALNTASQSEATVSGGAENTASGIFSTVSGGYQNIADGQGSFVAGGVGNQALGDTSFAAGNNAHADHNGAFVWADNTGTGMSSSADNQFNVYATGGVNFQTGGAPFQVNGKDIAAGEAEQNVIHTISIDGFVQPATVFADLSTLSITNTVVISGAGGGALGEKVPGLWEVQGFDLYCTLYCEDVYLWFDALVSGSLVRRNVSINVQDELGSEIQQWSYADCWPYTLQPEISSDGTETYERFGVQCDTLSSTLTSAAYASNALALPSNKISPIALLDTQKNKASIDHQVPHSFQISGLSLPGTGGMWVDLQKIIIDFEIIKFQDAGTPGLFLHIPGRRSYTNFNVVCIQDCPALHSWYEEIVSGAITRRDGSIMINDDSNPVEWLLYDCFPASLMTTLSADGTEAYPTYTMACNTFEIFASPSP